MAKKGSSKSAKAGSAASHKAHPKGKQTPKQLAAERANLVRARAALKRKKTLGTTTALGLVHSTGLTLNDLIAEYTVATSSSTKKPKLTANEKLGRKAGRRTARRNNLRLVHHPLGSHEGAINLHFHTHQLKTITGIPRKFESRIAPTSPSGTPGGWRKSHSHHHRKRLYMRKARVKRLGHWRKRKTGLRPR